MQKILDLLASSKPRIGHDLSEDARASEVMSEQATRIYSVLEIVSLRSFAGAFSLSAAMPGSQ
jgi:hypothetical protein